VSANSRWPGVVKNRSSMPVWVLWDEGDGDTKKWFAQPLAPGRRSPKSLDIDGVSAYEEGMRIANLKGGKPDRAITDWWWLNKGAEVNIKDGFTLQIIEKTSLIGSLTVTMDSEVAGWAPSWLGMDASWGIQL
jgi:hypothetical protein